MTSRKWQGAKGSTCPAPKASYRAASKNVSSLAEPGLLNSWANAHHYVSSSIVSPTPFLPSQAYLILGLMDHAHKHNVPAFFRIKHQLEFPDDPPTNTTPVGSGSASSTNGAATASSHARPIPLSIGHHPGNYTCAAVVRGSCSDQV